MRNENTGNIKTVDAVVIGGGVLGCFAARNLLRWNLSVLLIEEKEDVCTGITRANSAIVYSGYDNKAGSRKAQMTVRGNAGFEELCRELDVPFKRCGSLAVASGPCGEQVLRRKYENGMKNEVPGLRLLSGTEARAMEPHLSENVTIALYAPTTGTVNPWKLGIAAYESARQNGCRVWLNTKVTGIEKAGQGYLVECEPNTENHLTLKNQRVSCQAVLNCAGLCSDQVQEFLFPPSVRLFPDGGGYLVFNHDAPGPEHIIFQEAENGKGITAVPTVERNLLAASPKRELPQEWFATDDGVFEIMKQMGAETLPRVDFTQVIRSFGAVRPNPHRVVQNEQKQYVPDGKSIGSFSIENPAPGFYSLIGIKTPGLTCADELGMYLAKQTAEYLNVSENPAFDPVRKGIPSVHSMDYEQRADWVAGHPEYGEIICLCEDISRGEILEAIRRGAVTVDGVKRRVGAGLGQCQGSRCSQKIAAVIKEFAEQYR